MGEGASGALPAPTLRSACAKPRRRRWRPPALAGGTERATSEARCILPHQRQHRRPSLERAWGAAAFARASSPAARRRAERAAASAAAASSAAALSAAASTSAISSCPSRARTRCVVRDGSGPLAPVWPCLCADVLPPLAGHSTILPPALFPEPSGMHWVARWPCRCGAACAAPAGCRRVGAAGARARAQPRAPRARLEALAHGGAVRRRHARVVQEGQGRQVRERPRARARPGRGRVAGQRQSAQPRERPQRRHRCRALQAILACAPGGEGLLAAPVPLWRMRVSTRQGERAQRDLTGSGRPGPPHGAQPGQSAQMLCQRCLLCSL